MTRNLRTFAAAAALLVTLSAGTETASAQKPGGALKIYHRDSPASMSILEEATNSTEIPMMGVFNNLVLYKQDVPQNSLRSIIPDLATDWAWNEDGSELTLRLRQGVKWHDGHPFTANDVKCTWDLLLGKSPEKLRANPRKAWYQNVETVTADTDLTATFHLKRPQPAIIALLASGYAPVYPAQGTSWGMSDQLTTQQHLPKYIVLRCLARGQAAIIGSLDGVSPPDVRIVDI